MRLRHLQARKVHGTWHKYVERILLLQLPVVKSACAELIQETVNEETVPGSLELADRCAPMSQWMPHPVEPRQTDRKSTWQYLLLLVNECRLDTCSV